MRVVVTGGAGFFGSLLCRDLLADGHQVHVLDNLTFGAHSILTLFIDPNFTLAKVDVRDRAALEPHLQDCDVVVHLAALVGYPLCKKHPRRAKEVNTDGTRNVVELTPKGTRIVYASTGSNYGEIEGICTEDTPINPLSVYSETKAAGEALVRARENTASLRFATAFGISPRLRLDLMINDFAWQAIHQRYLVIYEKHFRRTFIHVRDMSRAVRHLLQEHDGVFNVGHESLNFTKQDIVRMLQQRIDFFTHFAEFGTDEDKRDYEVDYSRIRATGYSTAIDIGTGLQELIDALPYVQPVNPYGNV